MKTHARTPVWPLWDAQRQPTFEELARRCAPLEEPRPVPLLLRRHQHVADVDSLKPCRVGRDDSVVTFVTLFAVPLIALGRLDEAGRWEQPGTEASPE